MRKTLAMLAAMSTLGLSGCATNYDSPEVQARAISTVNLDVLAGIGMKVAGAKEQQRAGDAAQAGDIQRAKNLELQGVGVNSLGDYTLNRTAQRDAISDASAQNNSPYVFYQWAREGNSNIASVIYINPKNGDKRFVEMPVDDAIKVAEAYVKSP